MIDRFLERALELARASAARGGGPFGAVVVKDGAIVGEGANAVVPSGDPTAHAEVVAIRAACAALGTHVLRGCEIYSSCEPCPMCLAAIHWARLDRVTFAAERADAAEVGFDDAHLYDQLARPLAERETPMHQALRDAGRAVLRAWFDAPDRAPY